MKLKNILSEIKLIFKKSAKNVKKTYNDFSYLKKPFIIFCLIYGISFLAIFRANFYYIDDLGRAYSGYQDWGYFSRHVSNFLSSIFHTSSYLTDISPLTQIIAILFLALASCIVIDLFSNNKKVTFWKIMAVLPVGLSPYFLESISYKYDSPYMALSILSVIIPFMFLKRSLKLFSLASFIGALVMCMTYQAASGIFLVLILMTALMWWNDNVPMKKIVKFTIVSLISYLLGIIIFKLFIMAPADSYANNSILPLSDIILGSLSNLKSFYNNLIHDFRKIWLILIAFITVSYIYLVTIRSKKNKILSFVISTLIVTLSYLAIFGFYIFLETPLLAPRAMSAVGVLIAILAIQCCNLDRTIITKLACACLSFCFISFSFTYGNALYEQKHYTDFRVQTLISDLNSLDITNDQEKKNLKIIGSIGNAPVIRQMPDDYKLVDKLVPDILVGSGWYWGSYYFMHYFNLQNAFDYNDSIDMEKMNLPVLKDNIYHTIRGNDKYILIELKS